MDRLFVNLLSKFVVVLAIFLIACEDRPLNHPYPYDKAKTNTRYTGFSVRPKYLDPAKSYSSDEYAVIGAIYEPPLQYHYLKKPYELEPQTLTSMPNVKYDPQRDITTYTLNLKSEILYQPHPCFVTDKNNKSKYNNLTPEESNQYQTISDFSTSTRELTAHDYINQIKRIACPRVNSPIYSFLSKYIIGLSELRDQLDKEYDNFSKDKIFVNYDDFNISGVNLIDRYTFEINIHGKYPQFIYWLAMPFFAPMPIEAVNFYNNIEFLNNNISLDWYPVGTGAYYLNINDPEQQIELLANPNFHTDYYPSEGSIEDKNDGLLQDSGARLPFVKRVIFSREKESIPYWNKFLQGYYDMSYISQSNFTNSMKISDSGLSLNDELKNRGITLKVEDEPTTIAFGFNMLDPIVGGFKKENTILRKAISLAFDMEEYLSIFQNNQGSIARGPIPPGILGHIPHENTLSYSKKLLRAKKLLELAGYPNGSRDGKRLQINYEAVATNSTDQKAKFDWLKKQFDKLGIELIVRITDYSRFLNKIKSGDATLFQWGWNADYPDPENFLFMFYGPNSITVSGGKNPSNYQNKEFDLLFEQMQVMDNTQERQQIVSKMVAILQDDAPWIFGYHPVSYTLAHQWNKNQKSTSIIINSMKYQRIDFDSRLTLQKKWNQVVLWPFNFIIIFLILVIIPTYSIVLKEQKKTMDRF